MDIVLLWPYLNTIKVGWEICSAIHFNAYSARFKLLGSCVAYGLMLFQSFLPSLTKTIYPSLKKEIKELTLKFSFKLLGFRCYQPPGLSSFDFRLSVPLLLVSRFYFRAKGALVKFWKELVLVLYV
nr:hypothetical protein CFP56_40843 [Quercus suber]